MHLMEHLPTTTISSVNLSKEKGFVSQGFLSDKLDGDITPYQSRARELRVIVDECILSGARVIVPLQGQQAAVLNKLHDTYPGCSKMKALARYYIWWQKIASANEEMVKTVSGVSGIKTVTSSSSAPPLGVA